MKGSLIRAALLTSTIFGLGAVSPAHAQADEAAGNGAGDIIVTARRVEERLQDVPISITVFSGQQLANRNIVSAADIATYTPSLSVNNRYGRDTGTFAIRGFTQELNTAPSVAVYFADVVAPRAQGGTSGGNGAGVGSFFDLQNVQVLKGPQGTLFGRNTTGGAVLLVPQKPTHDLEGYVEGSTGNYDMWRLQGVLNLPLSDGIRLRLGADRQTRDGFLHNKSGIGPKDFDDVNYIALRGSLVIDVTPALENYTIVSYSRSKVHGFYPKMALCNPGPAAGLPGLFGPLACAQLARQSARGDGFFDVENGNPFARQRNSQWQAINTTTWAATDTLTIKNVASYAEFQQDQIANMFGENFFLAPGVPIGYVGLYTEPGLHNITQWTFTEELQFQGRTLNGNLNWQAGVYYEKSGPLGGPQGTRPPILLSCANPLTYTCNDPIRAGSMLNSIQEYRFRGLGLYAQGTYRFTDQLSLTAGLRYTSDRIDGAGFVRRVLFPQPNTPTFSCVVYPGRAAPTPEACEYNISQKSDKPTWMIDLEYKPVDDVMLYAKYSRGYRQGGLDVSNPGLFEKWNPEKVDTYEIGTKASFRGAVSGYVNFAAFYNDFTDQQLQSGAIVIPPQAPVAGIVNAGSSRIWGVEIEGSVNLFKGFNLSGSYAYLNTELQAYDPPPLDPTRFSGLVPTVTVGGPLTLSPKHNLSVTASYTLPIDENAGKVTFGATFTHTAKQLAAASSPIGVLPAISLVNLNFDWKSVGQSPLDVSVFATNVANKKYATMVGGSYTSTGFETIIVGQPRMFGIRARIHFGN